MITFKDIANLHTLQEGNSNMHLLTAVTYIPLHFICGIIMGYFCSTLKFKKLPVIVIYLLPRIIIPVFCQCVLTFILFYYGSDYGMLWDFIYLFILMITGFVVYKVCSHAIESSQMRDVKEKLVEPLYKNMKQ